MNMKSPKLRIKKKIVLNTNKNFSTKSDQNTTLTTGIGITLITNNL